MRSLVTKSLRRIRNRTKEENSSIRVAVEKFRRKFDKMANSKPPNYLAINSDVNTAVLR